MIELAPSLAERAGGANVHEVLARTVRDALEALTAEYPGLENLIWRDAGRLSPFIVIFLNERNLSGEEELERVLAPGDTLTVVTALEGGAEFRQPDPPGSAER